MVWFATLVARFASGWEWFLCMGWRQSTLATLSQQFLLKTVVSVSRRVLAYSNLSDTFRGIVGWLQQCLPSLWLVFRCFLGLQLLPVFYQVSYPPLLGHISSSILMCRFECRASGTGPVALVLAGPFFSYNNINYSLSFTFCRCSLHVNQKSSRRIANY